MSGKKDLQQLIREKRHAGWSVTSTGSHHYRWVLLETGAIVFSPSTPGDRRSFQNVVAKLRRAERERSIQ